MELSQRFAPWSLWWHTTIASCFMTNKTRTAPSSRQSYALEKGSECSSSWLCWCVSSQLRMFYSHSSVSSEFARWVVQFWILFWYANFNLHLHIDLFQRDVTKINPLIKAQFFSITYYVIFSLFSFDDFKFAFIACVLLNCYVYIILKSLKAKFKEDNRVCTVSIDKMVCKDFYDVFGW